MKKGKLYIGVLLIAVLICTAFTGCSTNSDANKTPQDYIMDAYGNTTYTISFSQEDLDKPLDSITYSAKKMPTLPTPGKVGYIFSGWYLDKECTIPYTDGILYLYMRDIVLYPKWIEEEFVVNGTYDIEFEAYILEDTVKLGSKTEEYGGYKNFAESIIKLETYIEKSDHGKVLKIQYDTGYSTSLLASSLSMEITVARESASQVRIEDKIIALNDQIHTVFLDIDDIELSDTIYLNISTTNYGSNVPEQFQTDTTTQYTVAFRITKIIGFTSAYEDTDVPLEEGWYLAKTYYTAVDGSESMGGVFNPVYSYIYSDGTNYTLVKQNIPYDGLVSNYGVSNPDAKLYDRMMSFIPVQVYFFLEREDTSISPNTDTAYFPSANHATYWGDYAVEFHANTEKNYNIFYLGNSLKREMVVQIAVTGYMEVVGGMGQLEQLLTIDYEHIIKLSEVDYEPLTGDFYEYQSEIQYYPGDRNDVTSNEKYQNLGYELILENGLSTEMINFFYSVGSSGSTVYSSRIEFTPTAATNARTVSDSRYIIAEFDVNAQIYGYDITSGDRLYADSMTVQTFGSSSLRETVEKAIGKSASIGDTIRLADLYAEKVNKNFDFSLVDYKIYEIVDGAVDYSRENSKNSSVFTFEKDIAILFTSKYEEATRTTLVELVTYYEPEVKIKVSSDFPYDADALYSIDSTASYPNVMYTWMGTSGEFIGDYYNYYSETPIFGVNPTSVAQIEVNDSGSNTLIYAARNAKEFTVGAEKTIVLYELKNKYGERYYYEVEFNAVDSNLTYSVTDSKGVIISNGKVTYNEKDNSLRKDIFATYTEILIDETYREQLERTLYYTIGNTTECFGLSKFSIYTDASYEEDILPYTDITTNSEYIWRAVKDSKYALLIMTYKHESDIVNIYYLYNVNFNGSNCYEWMSHPNYFSNITYTYPIYTLYGSDGTSICNRISVVYSQGVSTVLSSYQQSVTFNAKGTYTATLSFYITDFEIFGGAKRDGITLNLKQTFEVLDRYDDVYITYVTDPEHPFDDGTTERTVIYSLANDITTLSKKVFDTNSDILYGWVIKPRVCF